METKAQVRFRFPCSRLGDVGSSIDNSFEATSMMLYGISDCDVSQMACATFMGDAF
jgi:hypothetical protein